MNPLLMAVLALITQVLLWGTWSAPRRLVSR